MRSTHLCCESVICLTPAVCHQQGIRTRSNGRHKSCKSSPREASLLSPCYPSNIEVKDVLVFCFQAVVTDLLCCCSGGSVRNPVLLLHRQRHQGDDNSLQTFILHVACCSLRNMSSYQAKDAAEQSFLLTLDSLGLSQYRSVLR